jgi:hypothetical protein
MTLPHGEGIGAPTGLESRRVSPRDLSRRSRCRRISRRNDQLTAACGEASADFDPNSGIAARHKCELPIEPGSVRTLRRAGGLKATRREGAKEIRRRRGRPVGKVGRHVVVLKLVGACDVAPCSRGPKPTRRLTEIERLGNCYLPREQLLSASPPTSLRAPRTAARLSGRARSSGRGRSGTSHRRIEAELGADERTADARPGGRR